MLDFKISIILNQFSPSHINILDKSKYRDKYVNYSLSGLIGVYRFIWVYIHV